MNICKTHIICKEEIYAILLGHVAFSGSILFCHCQGVETWPVTNSYCLLHRVVCHFVHAIYFKLT